MSTQWDWPGSRWWKCDFHLHSPGSYDFVDRETVSAAQWVQAVRDAGLDSVAVTDHNIGILIAEIQQEARSDGRELTIFPGVELTVSGGIHLLVLFDPGRDGDAVTAFLGRCEVPDVALGMGEACATCSVGDAMKWVNERGAICIAAHVDDEKGLLKVLAPGQTLQQIITSEHLQAVEANVGDPDLLAYLDNTKDGYVRSCGSLPILSFSDAHALDQIGRRYTWVKMTRPDLEGLRLAFQDGPLSTLRDADAERDPNTHAALEVESIQIQDAKYIGRGGPFLARLNPWLNAVIGGRGTGKSSLIEFLRIALRRENELVGKLQEEFEQFKRVPRGRDDRGLLTESTQVVVTYRKDGGRFRVQWDQRGTLDPIQEEQPDGSWIAVDGDVRRRFPVRIYSQKQIFELATGPKALLRVIDEAREVDRDGWDERWRQEESRFLALRAKARELEATIGEEGRHKGELDDVIRKLAVFEAAGHQDVLQNYQKRQRQDRTVIHFEQGIAENVQTIRDLVEHIVPNQFDMALFDSNTEEDAGLIDIVQKAKERIASLQSRFEGLSAEAEELLVGWRSDVAGSAWRGAFNAADGAYRELVGKLEAADAGDPSEYGRLVRERQTLEQKLIDFVTRRTELEKIRNQADASLSILMDLRLELTRRRSEFLIHVLGNNPHVRIEVVPYGDSGMVESEFRAIIGRDRPTFQNDIWSEDDEEGLLPELYRGYPETVNATELEERLVRLKQGIRLIAKDHEGAPEVHDRRFVTYLAGMPPEVFDRLDTWFPNDSLRVTYSPRTDTRDFRPIEQGSPGQKTAAILAFLLSYGEEPMILDQPEDDLDNQLIYDLIVRQLRENKQRRQILVVTHNPNIVVNGDAECVLVLEVRGGQTLIVHQGGLQEQSIRNEICRVMEGGREAFELRYRRILGGGRS